MRACVVALVALALVACSYDLSAFEQDAGPVADAGSGCDPIALTGCGVMTTCSAEVWSGNLEARCTVFGSGTTGSPCTGAGLCATGFLCAGATEGEGSCTAYCAEGRACPAPLACSTEQIASSGGRAIFRCVSR